MAGRSARATSSMDYSGVWIQSKEESFGDRGDRFQRRLDLAQSVA